MSLKIEKKINGDDTVVELEGKLDTTTAPELDESLAGIVDTVKSLVLDFSKLEYISSAGLRVILKTHKSVSANGNMKLIGVNDSIMEVFDITGFSDVLNIEE